MHNSINVDNITLFPSQQELLDQGYRTSTGNWLICAPTGSGKTLVGEWAMLDAIQSGYTAAYIAPLKAIVEEKTADWARKYQHLDIGLFTGDTDPTHKLPGREQLLLFTPEKLNAYLQGWKLHLHWISRLGVLVIDEFHFVGIGARGLPRGPHHPPETGQSVCADHRVVGDDVECGNARRVAQGRSLHLDLASGASGEADRAVQESRRKARPAAGGSPGNPCRRGSGAGLRQFQEADRVGGATPGGGRLSGRLQPRRPLPRTQANLPRTDARREDRRVDSDLDTGDGVNFPARKVVIFDSYAFDGETFAPLTVQRYLQFAGRAGRAGLDATGEAVLFLPTWDNGKVDYLVAPPEPVRSGLFAADTLLKEILCEVAGRLSISERHLEVNFAQGTLWRAQGGQLELKRHVDALLKAGLIKRAGDEEEYLTVTALGRVTAQMGVAPAQSSCWPTCSTPVLW